MATLSRKLGLLRGMLAGDTARTGPVFVDVDLTQRCNLRCLGCIYHSAAEGLVRPGGPQITDLSLDLFRGLCTDLKALGTRELILQGAGEPFLYPHLVEAVALAKGMGFHVLLFTNGTLLERDIVRALIDARLDGLKLSLWASSRVEYARNYPGSDPGLFAKVVEGMRLLSELKAQTTIPVPRLILHNIINRHNLHSIDAIVDLAVRVGANELSFAPMQIARGPLRADILSLNEQRQLQDTLARVARRLASLSIPSNARVARLGLALGEEVWRALPCYTAWYHARVRTDGMIQPCARCGWGLALGYVQEGGFQAAWNGPAMRAFRRQAMTIDGLAALAKHCDCGWCCYFEGNGRVHRIFKWFAPLAALRAKKVHPGDPA